MVEICVCHKIGRTGNNLFQLAFGIYLRTLIPDAKLNHFSIRELGISNLSPSIFTQHYLYSISGQDDGIGEVLNAHRLSELKEVHTTALGMKHKYFSNSLTTLDSLIPDYIKKSPLEEDFTLIHVRGGDIWKKRSVFRKSTNLHPDYYAIPFSFYDEVCEKAEFPILFLMSADSPVWYRKVFSKRYRGERIMYQKSISHDFALIYSAKELALSVSSFSYMASALGKTRKLHIPILGLLNSEVRPDINLPPLAPTSVEYRFEDHKWSGTSRDKEWLFESKTHVKFRE